MAVVTNLFPEIYPTTWEPDVNDDQLRTRAKNGFVQINTYDAVVQWLAKGAWETLTGAQRDQIEDHWFTNKRLLYSLFNFWSQKIRGALIGLGNGSTTVFNLPAKNTSGQTVKVNGTAASPQPTISIGTGPSGLDQATFSSAPANGAVLTLDANAGQQLYDVNYKTVSFPPRHREADVWTCEIEFEQAVGG